MNLEHLRYFETIAKLEHYGKAASLLHVTQPNLSHAMAQLEDELEIKLFEKSGEERAPHPLRSRLFGSSFRLS